MKAWWSSVLLLTADEALRLLRTSRGILFIAAVGVAAVGSAASLDAFLTRFADETGLRIEPGFDARQWSTDAMVRQRLEPYAEGRPLVRAVLSRSLSIPGALFAWVLGFVVPWLLAIAGHARIAEDRRSGYLRFVFLRVHRSAYLVGKLLALWLFGTVVVAVGIVGHATWWTTQGVAILTEAPILIARAAIYAMPFAALVTLASSAVRSPVASLTLVTGAFVGFAFAAAVADAWTGSPWARLWVGWWSSALWAGQLPAVGAHVATAGLAGAAAWMLVRWRDA